MKNEKNKNYETVLLERMEGKIDAIIEGQKITDAKVDSLETKVDSLEIKLESVKSDTELLKGDMDYVKSTLMDDKDKFKKIDERADDYKKRLVKLENPVLAKA